MNKQVLIASAILATTAAAQAATNEIIITAPRVQTLIKNIPGNPTIINDTTLEQGGFSSVPEALKKKAGLHVRSLSDNPNRMSVDLRGFGENSHGRVLILVNGRRINRPDQAPVNWSQIPFGNIDRIEVVRGAHTALYGDYAVGGVINIITRRGETEPETDIDVRVGSHGYNSESISTSGNLDGIGYTASIGRQAADGYRKRSEYQTLSEALSLEADITDWLGSWIDYSYIESEYEMPGGLSEAQLKQDRRQAINTDDDSEERFHTIAAGLGFYPDEHHQGTLDAGFSRKEIESNFATFASFNTWTIDTYSLSPKYVNSAAPFDMDNTLTLGVDASIDELDITLYGDRPQTIRNGSSEVEKETAGFYVHDMLAIQDNLILSGGARIERAEYSIVERDGAGTVLQDTSDTHDVNAWNAGITYRPTEPLKIFARIDQLYRLPFLDEQILYAGFGSGFNKDLKPETGIAYEVGFAVVPSDELDLQCTLFRMDMEDEIAYVFPNNVNLDETRHQGVELSGSWQALDVLGFYANYTFQQVEFTAGANDGNNVPLVPQNLVTAGLDWNLIGSLHVLADVAFTDTLYAGGAVGNSTGTELDSYTLVDIALRYTHALEHAKLDLFIGIDNLFGEEYSPTAFDFAFTPGTIDSYYPAPERTYKAGMKLRF